jgi:carboxymethylenebutenolidase
MIERDVIVTTKYGQMPSFTCHPDSGGPFPAILFYMDAHGIREELRHMARRIAKQGYFVVLPDMYYRMGHIRFDIARRNDAMSAIIRPTMNHLSNEMVMDDTAGLIGYIDGQDAAKAGPIGCVGYCMSGRHITNALTRYPDRMKAGASLYGVGIVTEAEDSPHLVLSKAKGGELYYAFAETDQTVPDFVIPKLRAALAETGVKSQVDVYPGTFHGFAFPERPVYDHHAAEDSWQKIFAMWARHLK